MQRPSASALALMVGLSVGSSLTMPVWAQSFFDERRSQPFFNDRHFNFWGGWGQPPSEQSAPTLRRTPSRPAAVDFSKAPAGHKKAGATRTILVLGDSMADWLGYGLEEAFDETPEVGVVRKIRTVSGLIVSDSRGSAYDWPSAAHELVASEKPDVVVIMLGLSDRQAIRNQQRAVRNQSEPRAADDESDQNKDGNDKKDDTKGAGARSYEFQTKEWEEAYGRRIDEMISVAKGRGMPVIWVGLPAIKGHQSTADASFLNELYRSHAARAGADYVDVWDGFISESGEYVARGPDVDGQIRRLRTEDGVHFTKAGAIKLAHFVEREINRILAARTPTAILPQSEPEKPRGADAPANAARPAAGPVVILTGSGGESGELLGGHNKPGQYNDPLASQVLTRGVTLPAPHGRADDFSWPSAPALAGSDGTDVSPAASTEPDHTIGSSDHGAKATKHSAKPTGK